MVDPRGLLIRVSFSLFAIDGTAGRDTGALHLESSSLIDNVGYHNRCGGPDRETRGFQTESRFDCD